MNNRGRTLRFPRKHLFFFNMLRSSVQAKTEHAWHFGATFFVVETNNEACHACERNRSAGSRPVPEVFPSASWRGIAARGYRFARSEGQQSFNDEGTIGDAPRIPSRYSGACAISAVVLRRGFESEQLS